MHSPWRAIFAVFVLTVPATAAPPGSFAAFVDDYYNALFAWDPTQATYAGVHDFDDRLADLSAANVAKRAAALKDMKARLKDLRVGKLTEAEAIDAEALARAIR